MNRRHRKCRRREKKDTSMVTRKKFTNGVNMFSNSRTWGRKKNEIIDRDRRKENNVRMFRSEVIGKNFKDHGDGPETGERISADPRI